MITVISPSKTQNFDRSSSTKFSTAQNLAKSEYLISVLKKLSQQEIAKLMTISPKLTKLNYNRYHSFSAPFDLTNAKQALLAFRGDVYSGIDSANYSDDDFSFAQNNLRILSGLYGVLRPLDLIQPYRLEMSIKLANKNGANLYKFWGDTISETINKDESEILVNLASNEYFKGINKHTLTAKILKIDFKELKTGQYKTIGIFAKRARGLMVDFIIKNRIEDYNKLLNFNSANYKFNKELSSTWNWVFVR